MMEKSHPKERKKKFQTESIASPSSSIDKLPPKIPTMDEFLSSRKGASNQPKKVNNVVS